MNALGSVPRLGAQKTCLTFPQIPGAGIEGHIPSVLLSEAFSVSKFGNETSLSISMKSITCTRPHSFGATAEYAIT